MHRFLVIPFLLAGLWPSAQKVSGSLQFTAGQSLTVRVEANNTINQQAGTQVINFSVTGSATHHYKVTKVEPNAIFLDYSMGSLKFQFEGMGQKKSFDSNSKEDRESPYGKQFEELLQRKYTIIINPNGKITGTRPETVSLNSPGSDVLIISKMLKILTGIEYSAKPGAGSFFKVLPEQGIVAGENQTSSTSTGNTKAATVTTLSLITDSTVVINYKTEAASVEKSEMMGSEAKTTLNSVTNGKIILDKKTNIIRKKTSITESKGATEAKGGTVPVSGLENVEITVKQESN